MKKEKDVVVELDCLCIDGKWASRWVHNKFREPIDIKDTHVEYKDKFGNLRLMETGLIRGMLEDGNYRVQLTMPLPKSTFQANGITQIAHIIYNIGAEFCNEYSLDFEDYQMSIGIAAKNREEKLL